MCCRFILTAPADQVARVFGLAAVPPLPAQYNVAPSPPVAAVGVRAGG